MAKKDYAVKQSAESAAGSLAVAVAAQNKLPSVSASQFVFKNPKAIFLDKFQDLSLPPIIKPKNLNKGDVIIGEISEFTIFDDGKKLRSTFITIHILRSDSDGKLERVGQRAALPLGAVLARSLGTRQGTQANPVTPEMQISEIEKAGWLPGSILAMQYMGEGQKRDKGMNNPHLWQIKAVTPEQAKNYFAARAPAKSVTKK